MDKLQAAQERYKAVCTEVDSAQENLEALGKKSSNLEIKILNIGAKSSKLEAEKDIALANYAIDKITENELNKVRNESRAASEGEENLREMLSAVSTAIAKTKNQLAILEEKKEKLCREIWGAIFIKLESQLLESEMQEKIQTLWVAGIASRRVENYDLFLSTLFKGTGNDHRQLRRDLEQKYFN